MQWFSKGHYSARNYKNDPTKRLLKDAQRVADMLPHLKLDFTFPGVHGQVTTLLMWLRGCHHTDLLVKNIQTYGFDFDAVLAAHASGDVDAVAAPATRGHALYSELCLLDFDVLEALIEHAQCTPPLVQQFAFVHHAMQISYCRKTDHVLRHLHFLAQHDVGSNVRSWACEDENWLLPPLELLLPFLDILLRADQLTTFDCWHLYELACEQSRLHPRSSSLHITLIVLHKLLQWQQTHGDGAAAAAAGQTEIAPRPAAASSTAASPDPPVASANSGLDDAFRVWPFPLRVPAGEPADSIGGFGRPLLDPVVLPPTALMYQRMQCLIPNADVRSASFGLSAWLSNVVARVPELCSADGGLNAATLRAHPERMYLVEDCHLDG